MNIHTLGQAGFWEVLDGTGLHVATVYGTVEAAEDLLNLLLPTGSVCLTPARTADETNSAKVWKLLGKNCEGRKN